MEIGEELKSWLQNENKTFDSRLDFAIKVWQSVDFLYNNKYEVICQWLANALNDSTVNEPVPVTQLLELFSLRAQPGLVSVSSKSMLIQGLLKRIQQDMSDSTFSSVKNYPQLLQSLINFELVQDALRADYDLLMSSYGTLFKSYENQLLNLIGDNVEPRHADFVLPILQHLRDYVQRAQNYERLLQSYTSFALQPLCELLLQLRERGNGFCCFTQLAGLEQQLTEHLKMPMVIKRISEQPLHVRLLTFECALFNQQFLPDFMQALMEHAFVSLRSQKGNKQTTEGSKLALVVATHTLESLRKHNITLEKEIVITFMANELCTFVSTYKKQHLSEVLLLLSAALRLNPLLLEPNVYQITIWMLSAPKQSDAELSLYSAYLVQLLDMFRRLSRSERFIMQLLKALREWLSQFELQVNSIGSKRRCLSMEQELTEDAEESSNDYLKILLKYNENTTSYAPLKADNLSQTWPSSTAGAAFSRLVSHLMSKPSIVIWKMLLHTFGELLEPESEVVLPANLNFAIELHAALLGQYLIGTRLAEQAQLYQEQLEQQRNHTVQVLRQFGRHLLSLEHNRPTMNAFLECVERASSFELLLAYYWPDGVEHPKLEPQQLHKFLPSAEWELIKQRVHNFGKSSCHQRLQRLELQLVESGWLLLPNQRNEACTDVLVKLMPRQLLGHLTREQKQSRLLHGNLDKFVEDADCVELMAMQLLQDFFASNKIKHALSRKQLKSVETPCTEAALANALRDQCNNIKQLDMPLEETEQLVGALQQLPLKQLDNRIKSKLWLLLFTLYHDVNCAQLSQLSEKLLEQLNDMLHFGQPLPICSYFPELKEMLVLVPIDDSEDSAAWRFYGTLFNRCIRRLGPGSDNFLKKCNQYFEELLETKPSLQLTHWRLLLLAIGTLSVQTKRMQVYLSPLLDIYGKFVNHKFRSVKKSPDVYKDFVQTTLNGYATYLSSCIKNASKPKNEEENATDAVAIDENFRRICKIYIGHSLNYRNAHAIRLLNVALTHRQLLHLDQDEIEFVLNSYWQQLNADIASESTLDIQSIEPAIKLIIGYKTNEDFLLLLRRLTLQVTGMQRPESAAQHTCLQNVLTLLVLFAKCSLSSIKGAMLNEHFNLISGNVGLRLPPVTDVTYRSHVMRLLEAQRALATNRTVPLTSETLDAMLSSMLDVNIKRFVVDGGIWEDFLKLHAVISENCLLLVRQHGNLMSDRATQLTTLCQDLVQAIVCYRSERKQAQTLSENELDGLADLGLKLVTLIAGIASSPQALSVKRVAPFLLVFTIKQMVTTERPTTLFEKVKVHMDRICHELISLCDHRAGHFILRASSEGGARMYESLVKDHEKYHKFRGKV